ncbi:pumilio-like proteiny domain family member 6 [Geosmithia morbida]|uniref:Pumilio-like proteiny domain family member 6 n=1 Tax=Geosmithia morbida TaxID=1094350 RepID=A0A9P4YWT0_9HYPO|nr:pumilio-like proteiny domain family member 6 [Geosmithia morbida]KAF4122474.1 pumilio-like proteiny domain family member 6 [Geosmithia morbida]
MAAKDSFTDKKRKASSRNEKPDAKVKKARVDKKTAPKPPVDEDSFEDFSDPEDGGVKLNDGESKPKNKGGNAFEKESGQTSREAHAKQKQLAQERKAAKPLAEQVQRTKKIWERLRIKSSVPKDERQKLVDELFDIITGRMRDFVLKHDATRAVQTAIKYATPERRKQIARELQGAYPQLAESRYAKFLIGKLMVHDDHEIRDIIIPEFYGKVRKLINHPEASWIVDDIYRTVATKEQKALMLREWYGPEFAIREMMKDSEPTADLARILETEPSKRGPIMKSLFDMINSLVQKKMTGFTMLHDAMLQYFRNNQPGTEEFAEFAEVVKGDETGDLLKNLAFTASGARLVCLLLAHGSAKDRKQILKAYKDTVHMMSGDAYAHTVILTAYDVVDDTKLTAKSVFPEILGEGGESPVAQNLVALAHNPFARLTVLYLLEGLSKSLFPAPTAYNVELLNEVREIRKTTSKKDADVRRMELVTVLSPHLLETVATSPRELTSTSFGCQFIADVLFSCVGDKQAALEAVADAAGGDPTAEASAAGEDSAPYVHMAQTASGSRMLKSLIQGGRFDKAAGKVIPADPPLNFANVLYPVIEEYVVQWATGPGSFVIVGLAEASDFDAAAKLTKTLKKNKKLLEKAATEPTADQKQTASKDEAAAQKSSDNSKKGKKKGEKSVGNMGSKILLEKI